jgi:hypothetical protein
LDHAVRHFWRLDRIPQHHDWSGTLLAAERLVGKEGRVGDAGQDVEVASEMVGGAGEGGGKRSGVGGRGGQAQLIMDMSAVVMSMVIMVLLNMVMGVLSLTAIVVAVGGDDEVER